MPVQRTCITKLLKRRIMSELSQEFVKRSWRTSFGNRVCLEFKSIWFTLLQEKLSLYWAFCSFSIFIRIPNIKQPILTSIEYVLRYHISNKNLGLYAQVRARVSRAICVFVVQSYIFTFTFTFTFSFERSVPILIYNTR